METLSPRARMVLIAISIRGWRNRLRSLVPQNMQAGGPCQARCSPDRYCASVYGSLGWKLNAKQSSNSSGQHLSCYPHIQSRHWPAPRSPRGTEAKADSGNSEAGGQLNGGNLICPASRPDQAGTKDRMFLAQPAESPWNLPVELTAKMQYHLL